MSQHLIFEGPELAGKTWLMTEVHSYLDRKYKESENVSDGCHYLQSDIGVFGTALGKDVIETYLDLFRKLKDRNIIVEKFCLSDFIYNKMYRDVDVDYSSVIEVLRELNFRIVLVTFPEDQDILEKRLKDKLKNYPAHRRILKDPMWYVKQQHQYIKRIGECGLDYTIVCTKNIPDADLLDQVINWMECGNKKEC